MFKYKKNLNIVAIVLIVILFSSLIPTLRAPVISILKYPLKIFVFIGYEIKGIIFYHRNYRENEQLKKEIGLLKQNINTLNEVRFENDRLRRMLSFKERSSFKVIVAKVIGYSPDNWSSIIIIDKGISNGIKRGYAVISYSGLVGRVIECADSTSKIMLINDSNFGVSAIVQRSRQEGLVAGALGNSLIMKYLPKDCDIKVSDLVLTSGLTDNYPKGLIIGTVTDVGEEFSGLSRYANIKPAVNLSSIEEVLVVIN
ncbi:MAG: rod shape-determining protein MreC [Candidatus Omnitrophota bacterium]